MPTKIIRDPVHDVISLQMDHPVDRLLFDLIACPEFQRLRRIRQLGMASLAYPGADHSRYSHSLGVMETARQMLSHLSRDHAVGSEDCAATLAGALLHDLGHGPFSHVFERVSGVHHEQLTYRLILEPQSEIHRVLTAFHSSLPARVVALLKGEPQRSFLSDLLSSQLDADRLDYLLRDNHMTGSQYGNYDLRWLLHALTIEPRSNRLAITWKGLSAVEAYLQARYHMYRNVYFHKVVRAGEGMVKLALQRAKRLAVQGRLAWPGQDDAVCKILQGRQLTINEFVDLDDISVLQCFKHWTQNDDAVLASLCKGLLQRKLFKTIDLSRIGDDARVQRIVADAQAMIDAAGGESAYAMFYDEPADTPYRQADGEPTAADEILIQDAQNHVVTLAEASPLTVSLVQQLTFKRIHVTAEWRDRVEAIAGTN